MQKWVVRARLNDDHHRLLMSVAGQMVQHSRPVGIHLLLLLLLQEWVEVKRSDWVHLVDVAHDARRVRLYQWWQAQLGFSRAVTVLAVQHFSIWLVESVRVTW